MRLLLIRNLASGAKDGFIYDYLRHFAQDDDEVVMRFTDGTTDVVDLLDDAPGFDAVIVAGGDGTIGAVTYALANTGIPILPFPAGTGNLLTSNLLSPVEPQEFARMTREMHCLDFDMGEIEVEGRMIGFNIIAGAGYDALIMGEAVPQKKTLGPMAYFQAALANTSPEVAEIKLTIDGKTYHKKGLGVIIVNFSRIQFEIPVTPGSDARDGMFEIAILKTESAFGLIPALIACIVDRGGDHPDRSDAVEVLTGRSVTIEADPSLLIQYDGEVPGLKTPMRAHVLEGAVRFIVSDEAMKEFAEERS